jgi:predicted RNA-binding Zn-ribbon protein involved in translation (DUF1610 family)
MLGTYDKRTYLQRAIALLGKEEDDKLPYVALELRRCMETIVYEKLEAYRRYVPGLVFEKWQPPQRLKALLQFEPEADENVRVRLAPEVEYGVPSSGPWTELGEHKALKLRWLEKNYHRLGNYLHVPLGQETPPNPAKLRTDMQRIAATLEEVLQSSIIAVSLTERVAFTCGICGQANLANAEGVRKTGRAFCVNPDCGIIYHTTEGADGWKLLPEVSNFDCRQCGAAIPLPNNRLEIGLAFECSKCGTEHVMVGRSWAYGTKDEISRQGRDAGRTP